MRAPHEPRAVLGGRARTVRVRPGHQLGQVVVDERRRRLSGGHLRPLQQGDEERRVGRDAVHPQLPHGARRPAEGRAQVVGGHAADHLRQQRVVAGVEGRAGEGPPVDADAGTAGRLVGRDRARGRRGRAVGQQSLGVDPGLHGDAAGRPDGGLVEAELGEARAAGQSQLGLDEVDPGHLLRDRVLDLDAGVGLDEADPLGRTLGVEVDQQLDRAHPAVAQGLAEPHRGRRHLLPQLVGQVGRRRDLDQLLAPPLEAALPRVEVDHGARAVAHELDLDVPGPGDEALQVERAVAEGRGRLPRAGRHRRIEVLGPRDRPHPPPTTPGDGLHHHGRPLAERGQEGVRLVRRGRALGARQHGEAAAGGQRAGRHLVPQDGQRLRLRPDEDQAGVAAALGERRLLGEEAVAGMDGVAPLLGGRPRRAARRPGRPRGRSPAGAPRGRPGAPRASRRRPRRGRRPSRCRARPRRAGCAAPPPRGWPRAAVGCSPCRQSGRARAPPFMSADHALGGRQRGRERPVGPDWSTAAVGPGPAVRRRRAPGG